MSVNADTNMQKDLVKFTGMEPFFIFTYLLFYAIQIFKLTTNVMNDFWAGFADFLFDDADNDYILQTRVVGDISPEKAFSEKAFNKFKLYDKSDTCSVNKNIEGFYYDKKEYFSIFSDDKNIHESKWKTRILYMTTPRGNIAMYYNPYKLGFAYFCDQSAITYDILNAVASQYVITYRCLDFFMDENITDSSPLIQVHFIDEKKKKDVDPGKTDYSVKLGNTDNSPFVRLKKYDEVKVAPTKKDPFDDLLNKELAFLKTPIPPIIQEKERMKNKFLYLGKMSNFSFLQPVPKKGRTIKTFSSALLDGLEKNAEVQNNCFSYRDYKNNSASLHCGL